MCAVESMDPLKRTQGELLQYTPPPELVVPTRTFRPADPKRV